ncbi:hypothetical protein BGX33_009652 [Mortierella sp. NVP41]|nr:hypothetical protein BGX33_009652 [Mortierella sp. NVP41]
MMARSSHPTEKSAATTLAPAGPQQQKKYLFQEALPTEIWRLVLDHVPTLDLFSLYNTSRYMRSLSASPLVQAMATKSLRLFFYQEYVRRVGVKFVFESFDLESDRVIFRPFVANNQYRFRSGMTLQSPQLEEIAVRSSDMEIDYRRVQCDQGRYYTIKPAAAAVERSVPRPSQEASQLQEDTAEQEANADMEADVDLGNDVVVEASGGAGAAVAQTAAAVTAATTTVETTTRPIATITAESTRGRTADENVYEGTKNFLDKSCPISVRKTGVRGMDGTRYSFLQTYPWSLQYQVESEQMGYRVSFEQGDSQSGSNNINKNKGRNGKGKEVDHMNMGNGHIDDIGNIGSSSSHVRRREQHHPQDEVESTPTPYSYARIGSSSSNDNGNISSSDDALSSSSPTTSHHHRVKSPEMAVRIAGKSVTGIASTTTVLTAHRQQGSGTGSSSNGPRFVRVLRFECSMNFLDPKRATRNVLGRWLEGKMYQWSKVLGGKKPSHAIQWPSIQQQQQQQQIQPKKQQKQKQQRQPLLRRKRYQEPQEDRRGDGTTDAAGSSSSTHSPTPAAVVAPPTPKRRGRVIRALDILLGPTDSDGSSVNWDNVRQHNLLHGQS